MEAAISSCPVVAHCCVVGEGRQCTAALVELDLNEAVKCSLSEISKQGNRYKTRHKQK